MAPIDLPFLHLYAVRGRTFAYYRRGSFRCRLRGPDGSAVLPGDAAFLEAYQRAHAAYEAGKAPAAPEAAPGTIAALIETYRASPQWKQIAPATRAYYEQGLTFLKDRYASGPVALMRRKDVKAIMAAAAWREAKEEGAEPVYVPSRANKVLATLSVLLTFAMEDEWRADNPAIGVERLRSGTGHGYRPWTADEVSTFLAKATPDWRFAALLALCTGQRGQDQVPMAWSHYDGTAIRVVEHKTRTKEPRWIPCHPRLKRALDARKPAEKSKDALAALTLLTRPDGQPWTVNAFQKAAGQAIREAGLSDVVWHGLRATAASWLAEAGCSDAEIMSVTGHTTAKMVQHYRRGADQRRLATAAIARFKRKKTLVTGPVSH